MERLTKLAENGQKYVSAIGAGYGCWGKIMERLAAYENTGLTPEQIQAAKETLECFDNIGIKRGNEIVQAEQEGRLAILPCKVGDDIWWIGDEVPFVMCDEGGVAGIAITKDGVRILDHHGGLDEIGNRYCYLTKEDAEKALEKGDY